MSKQIVTINVGSEIVFGGSGYTHVISINANNKELKFSSGNGLHFNSIINRRNINDGFICSINGIPVSEIEEVHIAGYNDKVTLKVGDTIGLGIEVSYIIEQIVNNASGEKWVEDEIGYKWNLTYSDYYYINGKKYHRNDIIIPDQVVDKHDEIDDFVVDGSKKVEPINEDNIEETLRHHYGDDLSFKKWKDGTGISFGDKNHKMQVTFSVANWLGVIEAYLCKELTPPPKHTLIDSFNARANAGIIKQGFWLMNTQHYYEYCKGIIVLATIPKQWGLSKQNLLLDKLIEAYKDY